MNYFIKDFDKKSDIKYLSQIKELADEELSPGFVTESELSKIESGEYFCSFATDENGKICGISFGRFIDKNELASMLRCSFSEADLLFPNDSVIAEHLGIAVRKDMRNLGITGKLHERYKKTVFPKTNIIIYGVWNRKGGEKICVTHLLRSGAVFIKTVPKFWYDNPHINCTLCKGRCTCDCDFYYINRKDWTYG